MFKEQLREIWLDSDRDIFEPLLPCYEKLLEVTCMLHPVTVIEIGVRAGYSTFTFLKCDSVRHVLGIDGDIDHTKEASHGGIKGYHQHARQINKGERFDLLLVNSHHIQQLPDADLIYVDGDHTTDGCYQDLCLAAKSTRTILVDDYTTVFRDGVLEVRMAVDRFVSERGAKGTFFDNGRTGLYLIELKEH